MGLFSYIADSFTNRGALDLVSSKDEESLANAVFLNETKPITQAYTPPPRNLVAQEFAQQTMSALPRTPQELAPGQMGPPLPNAQTYRDPAASTRQYYERLVDQERARETARAQEQLSDPMFRFRDTVTDVARNTVGLPFNVLSGGEAFSNDPSREAQSRHEARLEELDKLNGKNAELYDAAKDGRFAALETARNQRYVAATNRLNATNQGSFFKSPNPDFYSVESTAAAQRLIEQGRPRSEAFDALELKDNIALATDANGRPIMVNKTTGTPIGYASDFDTELAQQEMLAVSKDFTKAAGVYYAERPFAARAIRNFASKRDRIEANVIKAKQLLSQFTTEEGGVLQFIPGTDARTLRNVLTTLKANIGFDQINEMRQESKTGGALGQVTEKELAFLQAVLANLDQFDDADVLSENLDIVLQRYDESVDRLQFNLDEMDGIYGTSVHSRVLFNPQRAYKGSAYFDGLIEEIEQSPQSEEDLDAMFGIN